MRLSVWDLWWDDETAAQSTLMLGGLCLGMVIHNFNDIDGWSGKSEALPLEDMWKIERSFRTRKAAKIALRRAISDAMVNP